MFFTLRVIWMFLWEVFMGKDDYKTVLKKDKKRIVMFILLFVLLGYSIFVTKRLVQIGHQYVKLENEMEAIGCIHSPEKKSDTVIENATPTLHQGTVKEGSKTNIAGPSQLRSGTVNRANQSYFDTAKTEPVSTPPTETKVEPTTKTKPKPATKPKNTHYNRKSELLNALD